MPFKSKAQRRKFAELLVKAVITPDQFEEWNRETGGAELPERVQPTKKRAAKKKRTKSASARKRSLNSAARRKPSKRR